MKTRWSGSPSGCARVGFGVQSRIDPHRPPHSLGLILYAVHLLVMLVAAVASVQHGLDVRSRSEPVGKTGRQIHLLGPGLHLGLLIHGLAPRWRVFKQGCRRDSQREEPALCELASKKGCHRRQPQLQRGDKGCPSLLDWLTKAIDYASDGVRHAGLVFIVHALYANAICVAFFLAIRAPPQLCGLIGPRIGWSRSGIAFHWCAGASPAPFAH